MKLFLKSLSISIGLLCLGYIPLNAQNFNSGAVVFDADLSGRLWHISSQKDGYPLVSVLNGNAVVRQGQALDNYRTFIIEDGPNDGDGWTADVRWFHIRNRIDGKYLTVQGNDAGSPLGWESYVESTGEELWKQQFRLIATDQFGWYKLRSRLSQSGPDLNIEVDATGRLRVESAGDPFASEQKFAFNLAIPDHQGTQFVMVGKHNNDFISDRGYSQNGATAVHVAGFDYSCLWTFLDAGDGYHYVQNAFTGNYLSDEDSGIITMSTTQGENEKWELKPYDHTFALVSKAHNHYVGTNGLLNNGTPVFGVSAVGQGIKWVLSPVADLDPELLSGDYQQILDGAAPLNPCIDFGINFQKGVCERVGLPADAYYFPSVQEALKEYYGSEDLATQALQNFEFGNEGHRAELAYAFRNYILGNLARKLPGTRTALETAVVNHFESRVQQLRYQYASALNAKWAEFETAFGFNDNSNLPMSQLLDNLDAGDFDWPEMYAPDSEQQVLLNNYTSACKTFNLTNNSTAFGMKINLATQPLVWPGGAILMNLAAREIGGLAVNLIPQGLTDAAIRATQVITRQILAMCSNVGSAATVGMIAYQILVQEILDAREVTELEARVMDRIIWGNTPVFMFGVMNGTHELEKTQLMMDLDHEIGAPTSAGFQINNNDNVTKTAFSLVCNSSATIELDANGSANLIPIQLALGIIPECGGDVEFNMSQSQFDCSDLGTHNVFLEAHNTVLSRTCTVPVTIQDHTAPIINCSNTTIYLDAAGTAAITYNDVYQGGTDNCGVVTPQSLTQNFFGCSHLGTNTVKLTANDSHGNTASCQSFVTVVDNLAPAVNCKNKTVYLDANGAGSIETGDVFQSGADNCGVVNQVSVSPNGFDCSKIGSNSATLTVNDGHGNTNTCVSTITVTDAIAPSVACKNFSVNLNAAGTASITTSDAFQSGADNCGVLNQQSVTPSSFDCSKLGVNTVTLTVNDSHGNTNTCTSTVTVSDPIVPSLLCKNATISLNAAGQATLNVSQVNNGSYDNCAIVNYSLSQSVFSCANLGNNTVALSGIDASNNKSVCTATVTVLDAIVPLAKCKNATANLGANGLVAVMPSAVDNVSTDNCSFSLSVTPNSFTCGNVGLNTVTLRATDASGNSSSCTAQVNVKDISAPTAVCKNATVNLNSQGQGTLSVALVDNGSADNCGLSTMSLSKTHFNCSELGASPWTVSLTVKDVNNNTSTCSASVTVKDITAPTAVCANTTVSLGSNGTVTVFPADLAADSYDNCSVWSYLPAAKVYTSANLGNNNLNITVKDWSGNGATCTSVVKVLPFGNLKGSDGRDEAFQPSNGLDAEVLLFPNPSSGAVTLTFRLPAAQKFAIRAYDTSGRLIYSHEDMGLAGENVLPVHLTGIAPGLYLLDFQSESLKSQKRFVIQE